MVLYTESYYYSNVKSPCWRDALICLQMFFNCFKYKSSIKMIYKLVFGTIPVSVYDIEMRGILEILNTLL